LGTGCATRSIRTRTGDAVIDRTEGRKDMMIRWTRAIGVAAVATLLAASCGGGGKNSPTASSGAALVKGGVLRIGMTSDFHEALDPSREYYTIGWEFLRCCLARTLLSFNGKGATQGGAQPIPDLATAMPTASGDGLTWTFTIRTGVHYAPPLASLTVTSKDFVRAIERLADSATAASYPFYYTDITGFNDFQAGKATSISGLTTPDDTTLVVKLDKAIGYFPYLFTLAATAPIPPNPSDASAIYGVATGHKQDYGRFIVSSGPYMIQGADAIDFSKPADQQTPASGYQPGKSIILVRNPSWSASVDPIRKAYVDQIQAQIGGAVADIQNKIESGDLDFMDAQATPQFIQAFTTNPALKPFLHADPGDFDYYINMNMAMPPFDDVHVRKAMNFAADKAGLLKLSGGSTSGSIAGHIIPDGLLAGSKVQDVYASANNAGDITKAKAEMALSKYDTNHDGTCDASACQNILTAIDQTDPNPQEVALLQQDIQPLGLTLSIKQFQTTTMYTKCEDATSQIPLCPSEGWVRDFPDPFAFVTGLFSSASLTPSCCDDSITGATTEQLSKWGYANTAPTPNIDAKLEACVPLTGTARGQCYAGIDTELMTNVVPWIPFRFANQVVITSKRLANYVFDDFATWVSLDQIALVNGGK
jgi:peptide/nickel transport system substrate-binding protein